MPWPVCGVRGAAFRTNPPRAASHGRGCRAAHRHASRARPEHIVARRISEAPRPRQVAHGRTVGSRRAPVDGRDHRREYAVARRSTHSAVLARRPVARSGTRLPRPFIAAGLRQKSSSVRPRRPLRGCLLAASAMLVDGGSPRLRRVLDRPGAAVAATTTSRRRARSAATARRKELRLPRFTAHVRAHGQPVRQRRIDPRLAANPGNVRFRLPRPRRRPRPRSRTQQGARVDTTRVPRERTRAVLDVRASPVSHAPL